MVPGMQAAFPAFRLTICGIPELGQHRAAGVTHVLSITDPDHPELHEFFDFAPHRRLALRFHDIIDATPGQLAPARADVERLLTFGRDLTSTRDSHLLVHCHAGVSRSTASATLMLAQASPDRTAREVLDHVAQIRPRAWPNLRILELGDDLLERNGDIVAAASAVYRRVLDREPYFQEAMIDGGRQREVTAALNVPTR
ncbi:MAG TPA: protein-tyrosine-phosphatase [Stellaceae bacterium]|jgi:predicted protein tyrosine phosphatase|nr:protein-tyrosine-phosphatase [Stellaceae bacterium]